MMVEYMDWLEYATLDKEGKVSGVAEDAPPEIKEQWKKFMEIKKKAEERGAKI